MDICEFNESEICHLRQFLKSCPHLPFTEYQLDRQRIEDYIIEDACNIVTKDGFVLIAKEERKILGLISCEKLDWDSKLFGFNMGRIKYLLALGGYSASFATKIRLISDLLNLCCKKLIFHLSARVLKEDLSSIRALEDQSFRLMDILATYYCNVKGRNVKLPPTDVPVRQSEKSDMDSLISISLNSFRDTPNATDRFHADPALPPKKCDDLYLKWITDSLSDPQNTIFVAGKLPIGFNLCTIPKKNEKLGLHIGTFALTAVSSSERGKSIATSLLNESLAWFKDKVDIVETGGQINNYPIQRVWTKVGLKSIRTQCTFHWTILPNWDRQLRTLG